MKISVELSCSTINPFTRSAEARTRTVVVPIATIRLAVLINFAVSAEIEKRSACIR